MLIFMLALTLEGQPPGCQRIQDLTVGIIFLGIPVQFRLEITT